jgi:hypothetical protein
MEQRVFLEMEQRGFLEMEQRGFFPAGGPIVVFFAAVPG